MSWAVVLLLVGRVHSGHLPCDVLDDNRSCWYPQFSLFDALLFGDFIVGPLLVGDLVFSISLLPVVCAVALMKVSMSQFLRMEVTAINPNKLPGVVASGGEDDPLLSGDVVAISSSRPSAALMAATMS